MKDFTTIAPLVGGSLRRLEELLRANGFRQSEGLSPSLKGGWASEVWLRCEGADFFAARIDWMGHGHARQAHYHFEAFPVKQRHDYEHATGLDRQRRRLIEVRRFDPFTGQPSTTDPHAPLARDDR